MKNIHDDISVGMRSKGRVVLAIWIVVAANAVAGLRAADSTPHILAITSPDGHARVAFDTGGRIVSLGRTGIVEGASGWPQSMPF